MGRREGGREKEREKIEEAEGMRGKGGGRREGRETRGNKRGRGRIEVGRRREEEKKRRENNPVFWNTGVCEGFCQNRVIFPNRTPRLKEQPRCSRTPVVFPVPRPPGKVSSNSNR